jgi:hypothetical protein
MERKELPTMTAKRLAPFIVCLTLFCGMAISQARADEWNKKTTITTNEPLEVPGIVLPPGTYVFKLANLQSDRNVVQIWNADQTHLYTTLIAIPDYRLQPTGHTVLQYTERVAGAPPALRAWFYPGDYYGEEFVYPKLRATQLARANNVPVPAMSNESASNMTKPIKSATEPAVTAMSNSVTAVTPENKEVPVESAVQTKAPAQKTQTVAAAHKPKRLPQTASPLPLLTLIAVGLLGTGVGLRFIHITN